MDTFETWWNSLGEEAEAWPKRALASAAHGSGETVERARIRQLALAHAERWLADGSEFAAQALRELADELGDR